MHAAFASAAAGRLSSRAWKVSFLLFPACALYLLNPNAHTLLDDVSVLLYHAGRAAFEPMVGIWLHAGGIVAQVALPAALALGFVAFEKAVPVQLFTFWLGQNLVNLSMNLSVFGTLHTHEAGRLDWLALLTGAGLAGVEEYIGALIFAIGCFCFVLALFVPSYLNQD